MTFEEPLMIVKISVSFVGGYSVEDVIYYQYKLPMNLMLKYNGILSILWHWLRSTIPGAM